MTSRVDMHCHSTARGGLELAKRRGMDFVTITDHDTIEGCLELADRPDCFVSEKPTACFAGDGVCDARPRLFRFRCAL